MRYGDGEIVEKTWTVLPDEIAESPDETNTDPTDNNEGTIGWIGSNHIPSAYSITTPAAANGTVTVSPKTAGKGASVTVTAVPEEGYALAELSVTDAKGNPLTLTDIGGGKYVFTMSGTAVTVKASFAPVSGAWNNPYLDVAGGAWYYEAVEYVTVNGLMTGTAPAVFAPNGSMTRAMVWTVLARMGGENVDGGSPWYGKAQTWALAGGVSDGTGPDDSITREQLVTMLYRYAGSPSVGASELALLSRFTDGESVSGWAREAAAWAAANGILTGDGGALAPQGTATRAQVAAILARFCRLSQL